MNETLPMFLYFCPGIPDGYGHYDSCPFSGYEAERLQAAGITDAAYWYGTGDYCGAGQILFRLNGRWYHHDCGHCSCYGPADEIMVRGLGEPTIAALMASCTDELRRWLQPCADRLIAEGFE